MNCLNTAGSGIGRGPSNSSFTNRGGLAGLYGVGAVVQRDYQQSSGENGTSFGAGAGGARSRSGGASGGTGGMPAVIIIFNYP